MNRRHALATIFFAMMLSACAVGAAPKVLFYQPQRADLTVPDASWPALFAHVRAMGFDTLAVQWVAYGEAFTDARERAWLEKRLREARAARLQLIVGLGADPDFFHRQKASPDQLEPYLRTLARQDVALAQSWHERLGDGAIAAWYLPLEVDDMRWRDAAARDRLLAHLREEVRALRGVKDAPVYLSSFFAGNMAPAAYAQLLGDLKETGARVWVQDGAGTGRLTRAERSLYLAPLHQCRGRVAHGVVYELFEQTAHDEAFAARPLPEDAIRDTLAQQAPCEGDSVYFEMRYLPGMQTIRKADREAAGSPPRTHEGWAAGG